MTRSAKQNIFTHNTSVSIRGRFVHISTDTLLTAKIDTKYETVLCSTSYSVFLFTLLLCFHRLHHHFYYVFIIVLMPAVQQLKRITTLDRDTSEVSFINR